MVDELRTFEAVGAATGPPRPLNLPDGRQPWSGPFARHTLALKCEKAVVLEGGRKQKSSFVQGLMRLYSSLATWYSRCSADPLRRATWRSSL